MATFNIDWNQFKPSTKGGAAMPSAPAPTPVYKPPVTPNIPSVPSSTPSSSTPTTSSKGNYLSGGFIQKALDVVSTPYYALAGFNKGTYGELNRQKAASAPRDRGAILRSGLSNILPGIKNRAGFGNQPEDVNLTGEFMSAIGKKSSPSLDAAGNLVMSLATPSLAVSKIPGVSQGLNFVGKALGKVANVGRGIPKVSNLVEKVFPYFRRPEVGKIVRGAEESATGRVNQVFNQIKDLSKGLTREQQIEVGKIIEGEIKSNKLITEASKYRSVEEFIKAQRNKIITLHEKAKLKITPEDIRSINESGQKYKTTLSEIIDLPNLYKKYPEIKDVPIIFDWQPGSAAGTDWRKIVISPTEVNFKENLLHEIQHIIQKKEGLPTGGSHSIGENINKYLDIPGEVQARSTTSGNFFVRNSIDETRLAYIYNQAKVDQKLLTIARQAQDLGIRIGQEAKDQGLLPKTQKLGKYLPHIWDTAKQEDIMRNRRSIPNIVGSFFKKRTGKEGYLPEFAPSLFKGLGTEVKDIEINKMFKELADKYGTRVTRKASVPEGYVWAKDVVKNENLKKLFKRTAIPQDIADYIARTFDVPKQNMFDKATNIWKAAKTIYNPAYHSRNIQSNQILSDMQTGRGAVRTAAETARVALGKTEPFVVDAARRAGLIGRHTINTGFEELRNAADLSAKQGWFQKAISAVKSKPREFQQASEEVSKLQVFKATLEDIADRTGRTLQEVAGDKNFIKEAVDKAEEAIFSPYRISSAERGLAGKITPFYSFARQAFPFTAKTLATNPNRITKYERAKEAIENLSGDQKVPVDERTDTYKKQIQLPGKTKDGKAKFWDPTYIYPWGNFDNTNSTLPFGMSLNPLANEAIAQLLNYDTYTKKPVTTSNIPRVKALDKVTHLKNTVEPTFVTNILNKVVPALRGVPDRYGRERGVVQSLLDTLLGFKTSNANPESMRQSVEKSKVYNLRSLQKEQEDILTDPNLSSTEKARRIEELKTLYSRAK